MNYDDCKPGTRVEYVPRVNASARRGTITRVKAITQRVWVALDESRAGTGEVYFEADELHRLTKCDDGKAQT